MCWMSRQRCCADCSRIPAAGSCAAAVVRSHDTAPVPEPGLRAAAVGVGGVGPSGQVHPDAAAGDWSIVGDQVIIGIEPLGAQRIRDEVPNWILNRPASISGQIVLNK